MRQAAFADRIYGNPRIAQKIRHSPALQRAVLCLDLLSLLDLGTLTKIHTEFVRGSLAGKLPRVVVELELTSSGGRVFLALAPGRAGGPQNYDIMFINIYIYIHVYKFCTKIISLALRPEPDPSKPKVELEHLNLGFEAL